MTLVGHQTETLIAERLLATLQSLPEVRARFDSSNASPEDKGYDARIDLKVAGKSFTLLIEIKKTIYPRDVKQTLWHLRRFGRAWEAEQRRKSIIPILAAETISPGAKDLLRTENVGYYDSGGSLFVPGEGAYLFIEKPPSKTLTKAMRSLFAGRRAQVLHTLLIRKSDWLSVKDIAAQAIVSPATASQVLTELERFDWLKLRGQGPYKERLLKEPTSLLDAWAKQLQILRGPVIRRFYVPALKSRELIARTAESLSSHDVMHALTHEAAAQQQTPFLTNVPQVRFRALTGHSMDIAVGELNGRTVSEGANLVIIEAKSAGDFLFRERVDGIWLASPIHIYLDLLRGEGRAKEMADHFRKERIGF